MTVRVGVGVADAVAVGGFAGSGVEVGVDGGRSGVADGVTVGMRVASTNVCHKGIGVFDDDPTLVATPSGVQAYAVRALENRSTSTQMESNH